MENHVNQYVWLCSSSGVVGWTLDDINSRIDEFNSFPWHTEADFWDWLSWEEDEEYRGFSVLWRSKLDSKVHRIKR